MQPLLEMQILIFSFLKVADKKLIKTSNNSNKNRT
jgi:hypothetical protein